jgi:NADPH:quinone reductase-like Zn-dependent oxidoreductase
MPEPSDTEIRIKVRVSGVGPTDLKIRRGDLNGVFPLPEPAILGFETAGTVDAIGSSVIGVAVGDEVAAWLPSLGGYGEYALAATWASKPPHVTWDDAGALPASVEAAVGVLRQLEVAPGETLLILGAGGSVGIIATQLATRQGLKVIGAVGERDEPLTRQLGATPVLYGSSLLSNVREVADRVDATFDAAGKGGLEDAITLTGGSERVITLADEHAAELGRSIFSRDARSGPRCRRDRHAAPRFRRTAPAIAAVPADVAGSRSAPAAGGTRTHDKLLLTPAPELAEVPK